jgi:glycosyltransferase involved in cell wall biosynthesis
MNGSKVVFFINSLGGGGAENICINIANGLFDSGWSIEILVLNLESKDFLKKLNPNIKIINLNVKRAKFSFIKLRSHFLKNDFSGVVCFTYELAVLSLMARGSIWKPNFKVISRNINSLTNMFTVRTSLWRKYIVYPLVKYFYGKSDLIINQCDGMMLELCKVLPEARDACVVIYNIVDQNVEVASKKIDFEKVDKKNNILCIGRLEPQKAHCDAISAFKIVLESHPDLRLKLVGKGKLKNDLIQQAQVEGVIDNIDFEDFKDNVIEYYLDTRLTILPSLFEGFPNVLVESVTLGTPVVAYDCPNGPSEIITDVNGILVEERSVQNLASAIISALDKSFNYDSIHRESVIYSRRKIIEEWACTLHSVLKSY